MPHQCVRCNTFYEDGSKELLEGCGKCKGKFFFYIKESSVKKAEKFTESLTFDDKMRMERDVIDIIGKDFDDDIPIVLDLENIKVLGPGKFELDLVGIFKGRPLVYKLEEGKYIIDVPSTFEAKEIDLKEREEKEKPAIDEENSEKK